MDVSCHHTEGCLESDRKYTRRQIQINNLSTCNIYRPHEGPNKNVHVVMNTT